MESDNSPRRNGTVDLDALLRPRKVRLGGREVSVKGIDGVGYQMLSRMKEHGEEAGVTTMYEVARRCLPDLTEEEVLNLEAPQVAKVVELASEAVELVEASVPKARAAGRKGAASP